MADGDALTSRVLTCVAWRSASGDSSPGSRYVETRVPAASVTKSLTAALAHRLHDDGRFSLDETCGVTLQIDNDALRQATWRDVLGHMAQLPCEWSSDAAVPDPAALLEAAARCRVVPVPHGVAHYSNFAYGLLGIALERRTGATYERLLNELLLEPLGMSSTSLTAPTDAAATIDFGACAPAGQLWSTASDLLAWGLCLSGGRPDVLSDAALAAMLTPVGPAPGAPGAIQASGVQLIVSESGPIVITRGVVPGHQCALVARRGAASVAWRNRSDSPLDTLHIALGALPDAARGLDRTWWLDGQRIALEEVADRLTAWFLDGESWRPLFLASRNGPGRFVDEAGETISATPEGVLRWRSYELTAVDSTPIPGPADGSTRPPLRRNPR